MQRYIARRFLHMLLVLFIMSVLIFGAIRLIPGDPATVRLGKKGTQAGIDVIRHELGLDRPVYVQYALWMKEVLQGRFGNSWVSERPAMDLIRAKLPATLLLTLAGMLLSLLITLPVGIISGIKPHSWFDNLATTFSLLGVALPSFWVGMILMMTCAVQLRLFPAAGFVKPTEDLGQSLYHLVLPAITVGIQMAANETRFLRSSMLDVMSMDYIRTARSKGLAERRVIIGHALKNGLLTLVTVFAMDFGALLGGQIVTETVFFWPGIGTLLVSSITNRDYGVIQAIVLFIAFIFSMVNLLADIAYAYLDPRIRY